MVNLMATLNDACRHFRRLSNRANIAGYMLALYGSTVQEGAGADIDMLAVPWRPSNYKALLDTLKLSGYTTFAGSLHYGVMGTCAVILVCPDGQHVDLQIREVKPEEFQS